MDKATKIDRLLAKVIRVYVFFIMFAPLLILEIDLDNDIWFLLNGGRYVLENGIPLSEPFTIHSGFDFVMQQWLTGVLFWSVYSKAGAIGLMTVVALVYVSFVLIMYKLCMLVSQKNFMISAPVAAMAGFLAYMFMTTRPQIFSILLLSVEVMCLESYVRKKKTLWLVPLIFVSLLQINMHASLWPMLFVILVPYFIDSFSFRIKRIKGEGYKKLPLIVCAAVMFAVGFINPYGIDAMIYLFKSYGVPEINSNIIEMKALDVNSAIGKFFLAFLVIPILVFCLKKNRKMKLRYALLIIGTTYLTLSSVRGAMQFAVCGIFPIAYMCSDLKIAEQFASEKGKQSKKSVKILLVLISVLLIACMAVLVAGRVGNTVSNVREGKAEHSDARGAVGYLLDNTDPEEVILYAGYNEGHYAEYHGFKSYMDARAEVFLKSNNGKEDILKEYFQLTKGGIYYKDVFDKYGFTHILTAQESLLSTYLPHDEEYRKVYSDEEYVVYEKIGWDEADE